MKNVKEIGTSAFGLGRNIFMAGLGVVATANDRSRNLFDSLVEKGATRTKQTDETPGPARKLGQKLTDMGRDTQDRIQTRVAGGLTRFGIPSRNEVLALTQSVETLTEKVQGLQTPSEA